MTADELINIIGEHCFAIRCSTLEETTNATNMLLGIGFLHGDSGYSERISQGDNEDGYMIPVVYCSNKKIEYNSRLRNDNMEIVEFEQLAEMCGFVDDFSITEEFDLDEFLNR